MHHKAVYAPGLTGSLARNSARILKRWEANLREQKAWGEALARQQSSSRRANKANGPADRARAKQRRQLGLAERREASHNAEGVRNGRS